MKFGDRMFKNKAADHGTRLPEEQDRAREAEALVSRRWFLGAVFASSGLAAASFVGANVDALNKLAVLSSRRSDVGVQGLPVQTQASLAGVVQHILSPDYRLRIEGRAVTQPVELTVDDLRGLSGHRAALPISCVQGWSVGARWQGVPVRDLLALAGVRTFDDVLVTSIQKRTRPNAMFTSARLNRAHALDPDTMLALELNGEPLHPDHGYPTRLIAPSNPGIMQTKWVERLEVR